MDLCLLITFSTASMGAVGIAVFWALSVMSGCVGGVVPMAWSQSRA